MQSSKYERISMLFFDFDMNTFYCSTPHPNVLPTKHRYISFCISVPAGNSYPSMLPTIIEQGKKQLSESTRGDYDRHVFVTGT